MSEGPAAVSSRASRERVPPALRRSRSNLRHADPTADAHRLMRSSSGVCVGSVVELGVERLARQQCIDVPSDGHSTVVAEVRQCDAWRERTNVRRHVSGEVAVCAAKRERELAAVTARAPVIVACCDSASAGCLCERERSF